MKQIILLLTFIFVSSTCAQFWEKISEYTGRELLIDNEGIIYLGDSVIYVSEDAGMSWNLKTEGFIPDYITCIEKNNNIKNYNNEIYVGTVWQGLFRSTNKGNYWQNIGIKHEYINCVISTSTGELFAGTDYHIFKSSNYGNSWRIDSLRPPGMTKNLLIWSLFEDSQGNIFAGTECGLYRSTDRGSVWNFIESFDCGDILSFAEKDNKIYMGGADRFQGILRSDDHGLTWRNVFNLNLNLTTNSILTAPDEKLYITSSFGQGIFRTTSADSIWEEINSGLEYNYAADIGLSPDGYLYAASSDLYRSREILSLENESELSVCFYLLQNYPNPFNPLTTINYSIPVQSNVIIKIFDTLGREIRNLVNEDKPAGNYTINFDAAGLACGIYLYRIQVGEFVQNRKMILMK